MADEILGQISTAEHEAKLVLLQQIKKSAEGTTSAHLLEQLAYAYALAVGGAIGKLPGGPFNVKVST